MSHATLVERMGTTSPQLHLGDRLPDKTGVESRVNFYMDRLKGEAKKETPNARLLKYYSAIIKAGIQILELLGDQETAREFLRMYEALEHQYKLTTH